MLSPSVKVLIVHVLALLSILKWVSGTGAVCASASTYRASRAFPEQLTRRTTGLTQQPEGYTPPGPQSWCQATKFYKQLDLLKSAR